MWKEISKESTKCWTRFWFTSSMIFVCVFLYPGHYDALIAWFKFSNSTVQCFIFYGFLLKTNCSNIWPHVDQSIFSLKYWIYRSVWKKYQRVWCPFRPRTDCYLFYRETFEAYIALKILPLHFIVDLPETVLFWRISVLYPLITD